MEIDNLERKTIYFNDDERKKVSRKVYKMMNYGWSVDNYNIVWLHGEIYCDPELTDTIIGRPKNWVTLNRYR